MSRQTERFERRKGRRTKLTRIEEFFERIAKQNKRWDYRNYSQHPKGRKRTREPIYN